jgi:DNA polymerase III gamma/tau subunit
MNILNEFRPSTLEKVIGNKSACSVIKENLNRPVAPHIYMITGPTGSGKTTLARIIASTLCSSETDINEVQLRGIDDTRALREELVIAPLWSYNKVYILDELHHLTKDGQNDLLKPFEEPPKHVYFVLTTTEPQKVIKTIQSRCVKIKTSKLNTDEAKELLNRIDSSLDKEIVDIIIEKADGLPRDIITGYAAVAGIDDVREVYKTLSIFPDDDPEIIELIRKVVYQSKSWEEVAGILDKIEAEPETIRIVFCNWLRKALLNNNVQKAGVYARMLANFLDPYYNTTSKAQLAHDVFLAFVSRFRAK